MLLASKTIIAKQWRSGQALRWRRSSRAESARFPLPRPRSHFGVAEARAPIVTASHCSIVFNHNAQHANIEDRDPVSPRAHLFARHLQDSADQEKSAAAAPARLRFMMRQRASSVCSRASARKCRMRSALPVDFRARRSRLPARPKPTSNSGSPLAMLPDRLGSR